MATITSVVQDEHQEKLSENGGLAIDLGEFEVRNHVKFWGLNNQERVCIWECFVSM